MPKKLHFVGVGGVGTGTLATALSKAGFEVTGSDKALYDPMKTVLASANVKLLEGFDAKHAETQKPDLVVIGNVVTKENEESQAWIRSGTPFISFPEAVRRFVIRDCKSIVCAGTHGKTTTSSWVSFLLKETEQDPSYLIGGVPHDLESGCVISEGAYFVGEGDEYDSAFFDKGPKFLHYNPNFAIINGIEFDHADIYRDLDHVKSAFRKLIALLPGDGLCIARYDDQNVLELVTDSLSAVQTFGLSDRAMWRVAEVTENEEGYDFEVRYKKRNLGQFHTPLFGEFNLMNLLAGIVVGVNLGISLEKIRGAVSKFHGVQRRQQVLLKKPITVIDDFAHHPTEVEATLKAVKNRFPEKRIWALFEPRSATARRNTHQKAYVEAFDSADQILISHPLRANEVNEADRFSPSALVSDLKEKGKEAFAKEKPKEILEYFLQHYAPDDVVVIMSNGEFDKIQSRIVDSLT